MRVVSALCLVFAVACASSSPDESTDLPVGGVTDGGEGSPDLAIPPPPAEACEAKPIATGEAAKCDVSVTYAPPRAATQIAEGNTIHAIDGATESAIRRLYFARDGVDSEAIPYMRTEGERVTRTLAWLDAQVRGPWCTAEDGFGLAELAVVTALEWMQFRAVAPLEGYAKLRALVAAHAERPSLAATRPFVA